MWSLFMTVPRPQIITDQLPVSYGAESTSKNRYNEPNTLKFGQDMIKI